MEWMGGTISKEDVGEDGGNSRHNKRRRDDDNEDEDVWYDASEVRVEDECP